MKKQYIKDNQIYNLPIVIEEQGQRIYTNDENKILQAGYQVYNKSQNIPIKTKQQQLDQAINSINQNTDYKILSQFEWKNMKFWLSLENQMNFLVLYNQRNTLPLTIKHQNGFYTFSSPEEYSEFYYAAIAYIRECIEQGWRQKEQITKQIMGEEYLNNQNNHQNIIDSYINNGVQPNAFENIDNN